MIGFTQLSFMFSALSVAYIKIIALTIYILTIDQKYEFTYTYLREPLILVIGMISGFRMFANVLYISKNTISWVYRIADTIIRIFYLFMFIISSLIPILLAAIIITPLVYEVEVLEKSLLAYKLYNWCNRNTWNCALRLNCMVIFVFYIFQHCDAFSKKCRRRY